MFADLLSSDIAVDLGSASTRVAVRGDDAASEVPSVVAVRTRKSGRREVVALGEGARAMVGRTPDGVEVLRPIRCGRVVAPDAAEALLRHVIASVDGRRWIHRRVTLATDPDAPRSDARMLRDLLEAAGAHSVRTLPSPLAAAAGAGLDPDTAAGHMVVDVGAGTTSVAVVCNGAVVASAVIDVAGDVLDGAIIRHLRRAHAVLIGQQTAERVKREIGAAADPEPGETWVAGRCLRAGVPRSCRVDAAEVAEAVAEPLAAISALVRRVLEQTPAEVAGDVVDHGVILTGASSRLVNLDLALRSGTGLAMLVVDGGDRAVIRGVARQLRPGGWSASRAQRRARLTAARDAT